MVYTHSLLYLSLVTLELVLEFLHKLLHALIGLVVLLSLEDQLLQTALILTQDLHCLNVAFLLAIQLCLQLSDLGTHKSI